MGRPMLNGPARNMEINNGNWRPRSAWDRAKRDFRGRNMVRLPDFDHLESTVVFTRGHSCFGHTPARSAVLSFLALAGVS